MSESNHKMREFETGATRDTADNKPDYEGFLSPAVIERYGKYMMKHQKQADGKMRNSDNWQKGIPKNVYMSSLWRHFLDLWKQHRGLPGQDTLEDSICAILFNAMGYLHEVLKEPVPIPEIPGESLMKTMAAVTAPESDKTPQAT